MLAVRTGEKTCSPSTVTLSPHSAGRGGDDPHDAEASEQRRVAQAVDRVAPTEGGRERARQPVSGGGEIG